MWPNSESYSGLMSDAVYQRGMRQNEIVSVTGYTRESVRRILRAAGVEPD